MTEYIETIMFNTGEEIHRIHTNHHYKIRFSRNFVNNLAV